MNRIPCQTYNCNTWENNLRENIYLTELTCPNCAAQGRFSRKYEIKTRKGGTKDATSTIVVWEIEIYPGFKPGKWQYARLKEVRIQIPMIVCGECNATYKAYPAFVVKGTTITLSALIFITCMYTLSGLSWRKMAEVLCGGKIYAISHTAMYKAVHGIGKTMVDDQTALADIEKLISEFPPVQADLSGKTRKPHTKERLAAAMRLVSPPYRFFCEDREPVRYMYAYTRLLEGYILKTSMVIVTILYNYRY